MLTRMRQWWRDRQDMQKFSAALSDAVSKMPPEVVAAHKHSIRHRSEIESSELCGCFYCGQTFAPVEITDWTDEDQTALCPRCGIDSVIGSASGYPIEGKFLARMHEHWFS